MVRFKVSAIPTNSVKRLSPREAEPLAPRRVPPSPHTSPRTSNARPGRYHHEQAHLGWTQAERHHPLRRHRMGRRWLLPYEYVLAPVPPPRGPADNDAVKYFSPRTNLCIIRVARDPHKIAWASVTLTTTIDGRKYIPHVVHVSGTVTWCKVPLDPRLIWRV